MSDPIRPMRKLSSEYPSITACSPKKEGYDFRFVEVGGPSNQDEEARSVIRAHVMRDFYDKRRQGKEPNYQPEVLSAASSKKGVSQQARRFKNGPHGLQELGRKRKKECRAVQKCENPPSLNATCIDTQATTSPQFLSGRNGGGGEETPFTPSGNFEGQSCGDAGGALRRRCDAWDPSSRDQAIRSDLVGSLFVAGDPFDTLPLPNCPRTQILIYHANNGILSSPLMGQLRTEWLSLATKDLALFHICLSHYAGNYGLAKQESDPTEALRFRMESMRLVNQRLDNWEAALSDGTISTVASLSSYEATNGSLSAVRTHLQGLVKMVKLRGGMYESGMNSYTMRLVLWADLNCANALSCDPLFPVPDRPEMKAYLRAARIQRRSLPKPSQGEDTGSLTELRLLSKDLIDKFIDLRYLANISLLPASRQTIEKGEQIMRSDEVYFTERSLLTLSNLLGPRSFVTSCCIAAIIYTDNHLRGIAFIARLISRHVVRLKLSMELFLGEPPHLAATSTTPHTIFWTLYVGGIAAGCRPERGWFVAQILDFCDLLKFDCWEDAESVLKNFLWPAVWDFQGILLWGDIEDARVSIND